MSGDTTELSLPSSLTLVSNAKVLLPNVDSEIINERGIIGSASDDVIVGSENADSIFGGRGSDIISGGAGDDNLYGGSGSNQISGGAGDDNIYVNYNSVNGEIVDGGEGIDKLTIDFTSNSNSTDVRNSAMYNIENIIFKNVNSNYIYINTEQLSSLDNVENDYVGTYPWDALRLNIYGDNGDDIDFSNFKNNNYRTVSLLGDFDVVDYSNNITAYPDSWYQDEYNKNQVKLNIQSLNDFIGSSGDDRIEIQDSRFDADLSSGDDTLILNASSLSGNIDGGEGSDTLTINYGFTDLTNATILNFENIDNGSNTILLTSEQFADLSLDGSGKVYIKENGVILFYFQKSFPNSLHTCLDQ